MSEMMDMASAYRYVCIIISQTKNLRSVEHRQQHNTAIVGGNQRERESIGNESRSRGARNTMNKTLEKIELYYGSQAQQADDRFDTTVLQSPSREQTCYCSSDHRGRAALLEQYNSLLTWDKQSSMGDGVYGAYDADVEDDCSEPSMDVQRESMMKVHDFLTSPEQKREVVETAITQPTIQPEYPWLPTSSSTTPPPFVPEVVITGTSSDDENALEECLRLYQEVDEIMSQDGTPEYICTRRSTSDLVFWSMEEGKCSLQDL